MVNSLAIIPARAGSKRLKLKNIKLLNGKPMVYYTISAAKKSKLLTDWLVSSEDETIIEIVKKLGANVYFKRPKKLSGDKIRNIQVIEHALEYMEKNFKKKYDIILLLQPTSPIRKSSHIDEAISLLSSSKYSSLASVKGPFIKRDKILKKIDKEKLVDLFYSKINHEFYIYNASIYAVKRDYFVKKKKIISSSQVPLIMDKIHSVDVDDQNDFKIAELFLNMLEKNEKN